MSRLTKEQILDGVRRAYRTLPEELKLNNPKDEETMIWISQAKTFLSMGSASINNKLSEIQRQATTGGITKCHNEIKQIFIDTITKLEIETGGYSFAIEQGNVFDYFDETRKLLETAKTEVFLIDPYVSADIVGDYFSSINPAVYLRVLTSRKQSAKSIIPAVEKLSAQNGASISVRSADNLHDRFWFIDGISGYQSSSSVKDGGKKSPALIMGVTDAFDAVLQTYEDKWSSAQILVQ